MLDKLEKKFNDTLNENPSVESLEDALSKDITEQIHFTSYKQVTRRNTCGGNVWSNLPPAATAREVVKTQEG
jgi:hypothetical protein